MSDQVAAPAAPVAPTNGAHPTTPQKPAVVKVPVEAQAANDDFEEYVVDGKPVRLTKPQRQLHFQKALAADKRIQEASEKQKRLDELEALFEADPEAYFAKKGKDGSKFIADHIAKKAKQELMSPEQREAERTQRELAEWKGKAEAAEKEKLEARQAEVDKRNFAALEGQLIGAADKHGLDSSPETLESLCDIALEFIEYGATITADQVAQEHIRREREHIETRDKKLLGVLSGQKLIDYLGKDVMARLKAAQAANDNASLEDIPRPQARPRVQVKAHEREVKGYLRESDFDKKFLK